MCSMDRYSKTEFIIIPDSVVSMSIDFHWLYVSPTLKKHDSISYYSTLLESCLIMKVVQQSCFVMARLAPQLKSCKHNQNIAYLRLLAWYLKLAIDCICDVHRPLCICRDLFLPSFLYREHIMKLEDAGHKTLFL